MSKLKLLGVLFLDTLIAVGWFWLIMRGIWNNLMSATGAGAALGWGILLIICIPISIIVCIVVLSMLVWGLSS